MTLRFNHPLFSPASLMIFLILSTRAAAQLPPAMSAATQSAFDDLAADVSQLQAGATLATDGDAAHVMRFGADRFAGEIAHPSFSPDGKQIVATSPGKTTLIFDDATGQRIANLPMSTETEFVTNDLLAQPQFNGVNLIQRDGTVVRSLDVREPQHFLSSRDGKRMVIAAGFARPDAPAGSGPNLTLWNTETGEQIADLGSPATATLSMPGRPQFAQHIVSRVMCFDANNTLLTVAEDGHVKLWNSDDGLPKPCADVIVDPFVTMALSPDAKSLILSDELPRQIDLSSGAVTKLPHDFPLIPIRQLRNGPATQLDRPLAAIMPGTSAMPGSIVSSVGSNVNLAGPRARYPSGNIQFAPDGKTLLSLRRNEMLRWDVQHNRELPPIEDIDALLGLDFSPDGSLIVAAMLGRIKIFNALTGASLIKPVAPEFAIKASCISDDGANLFVAAADGSLYRFDLQTGKPIAWRHWAGDAMSILRRTRAMTLSSDGSLLTLTEQSAVTHRDASTLAPAAIALPLPINGPPKFSPDGALVAGAMNGKIAIAPTNATVDAPTTRPDQLQTISGFATYSQVAFSRDNRTLAVADDEKFIRLFSLRPGQLPEPITPDLVFPKEGQPNERATQLLSDVFQLFDLRFTPDARTLLGISHDGPAAFDVQRRTVLWYHKIEYSDLFGHFAVSDDGLLMAYGDGHKSAITIVDTDSGNTVAELRDADTSMTMLRFIPGTTKLLVIDGTICNVYDWRIAVETAATKDGAAADTGAVGEAGAGYAALFSAMKQPDDLYRQALTLVDQQKKSDVQRWIDGLSAPDPVERERSHHALERAGAAAAPDERHALAQLPAGEAHDRLQSLLDLQNESSPPKDDSPPPEAAPASDADLDRQNRRRAARLIEALDWLRTDQSQTLLHKIERGGEPDDAVLAHIALSHQPRH